MGRQRQSQSSDTDIATDVANAIMVGATAASIAAFLLPLFAGLPNGEDAAIRVAGLVLKTPPVFKIAAGEFEQRASLANLVYRGFYAVEAAKRVSQALASSVRGHSPEDITEALKREAGHLSRHIEASRRRTDAAIQTDTAREQYGDRVTWLHGVTRVPEHPRESHLRASGKTWNLRNGIPLSTGSLPGGEPFCSCAWGPPRVNAEELV